MSPTSRAAIVTINHYEAAAVTSFMAWSGHQRVGGGTGAVQMMSYKWDSYRVGSRVVDHLDLMQSGNLSATAIAARFFSRPGVKSMHYDAIILFGCAGANPRARSPLQPGTVVIVEKATFAENGLVVTQSNADQLPIDVVLIKNDRLSRNQIQMVGALTLKLHRGLKIGLTSALCTEKIMKMNLNVAVAGQGTPAGNTYRELLDLGHGIIDMESFGFLIGLNQLQLQRTAVIRVITDSVTDHSESTEGQASDDPRQLALLERASKRILPGVLHLLDLPGDEALTEPQLDTQVEAAVQAAERAIVGSEVDAGSIVGELETIAAQIVPGRPVRTNDPETQLMQDLATTRRLGYGTARLGRILRRDRAVKLALGVATSLSGIAGMSEILGVALTEASSVVWVRRYDPTMRGRYLPAVRRALAIRDAAVDADAMSRDFRADRGMEQLPREFQGVVLQLDPRLIMVPRSWFQFVDKLPGVIAWDGFDDDPALDALFGQPRPRD